MWQDKGVCTKIKGKQTHNRKTDALDSREGDVQRWSRGLVNET